MWWRLLAIRSVLRWMPPFTPKCLGTYHRYVISKTNNDCPWIGLNPFVYISTWKRRSTCVYVYTILIGLYSSHLNRKTIIETMWLRLDGSSKSDVQGWSTICYLTCSRHLYTSKAVVRLIFSSGWTCFTFLARIFNSLKKSHKSSENIDWYTIDKS